MSIQTQRAVKDSQKRLMVGVGLERLSHSVLARRARYVTRYLYWCIRHRSTQTAAWIVAYEGSTWG